MRVGIFLFCLFAFFGILFFILVFCSFGAKINTEWNKKIDIILLYKSFAVKCFNRDSDQE